MICGICGKELEENSVFCIHCGAKQEAAPAAAPVAVEKPKKKKTGCIVAVIIAVVALILVIAIAVVLVLGALGIGLFALNKEVKVEPNHRYEEIEDGYREDEDDFYYEEENQDDWYNEPVWEETEPYEAVAEKYDSYVFSNSDSKYLNYASIDRLTDEERYIAEMEIFARHGQTFSEPDVQAYFDARHWYYPSGGSFNPNAYEEANLELFRVYNQKKNGTLYQGNNVYINAFPGHPEYAISHSNSRYLTDSDLRYMTENQLCVARNEILARHGRIFKDPYLREYFLSQPWYKPTKTTVDFDSMSSIEQSNYSMIEKYEDQAEINEGAVWSSENPYKAVYDEHGSVAYLFPNSDKEYLSSGALRGMTEEELTIAWAEIYARHGYIFNDYYLDEYFAHRNWYSAKTSNKNALGLNNYELENIRLVEDAKGGAKQSTSDDVVHEVSSNYVPYYSYGAIPYEEGKGCYSLAMALNEWIGLYLCDPDHPNDKVEVVWTVVEGNCKIDPDGVGVTATSEENCKIKAEYNGKTYYILIY